MRQPESALKLRFDDAFRALFERGEVADHYAYRTPIEKGRGQKYAIPDRFYTALRGSCWAEFKVHPNKLSPIQESVCCRMSRGGSRIVVVTEHPAQSIIQLVAYSPMGTPLEPQKVALGAHRKEKTWRWMLRGDITL